MARKLDPLSKLPNSEFWKNIKIFHKRDELPHINLRPAANLVGLFLFPYGWRWSEYEVKDGADRYDYERDAKTASHLTVEEDRSSFGQQRAICASRFRRRAAEDLIKSFLGRGALNYAVYYSFDPRSSDSRCKDSLYPINPAEFERLNVERSFVGMGVGKKYFIRVDAINLIELLIVEHERRGAQRKFERAVVEPMARRFIESWEPSTMRDVTYAAAMSWVSGEVAQQGGVAGSEPLSDDQLRPLFRELWLEYGLG